MSPPDPLEHPVAVRRAARQWSQAELARRAALPRSSLSAIESQRLTPSVSAALALGQALECSVEELFGEPAVNAQPARPEWAWPPREKSGRYWEAEVSGRRWLYPAESAGRTALAHDGICAGGVPKASSGGAATRTLVMASCDPAAGLLAGAYAQASGFRLLVLSRGSGSALDLLQQGKAQVAGLHRATAEQPDLNLETVRARLGDGYCLLRAADWEEGVALRAGHAKTSLRSLRQEKHRWALREAGSAARECLEELHEGRAVSGREVPGHTAVAEAVRDGWADAGVCVRIVADESGLTFLRVRTEALDLCLAKSFLRDPRGQALVRLLQSRGYRRLVSELPGYDARCTGELIQC
jgi:putative molybdopterin biosynthesis protein